MSDMSLDARRRFYAEELDALCGLQTRGLVDAFASVPRERYLPPGPWSVLSLDAIVPGAPSRPRVTRDADPARVYHNIGVAIDLPRQLFNGHPATLASWIDALALTPGARVLHVGCGLGYYAAVMAHTVGPSGTVTAIEVDAAMASQARANLASTPWVTIVNGDASAALEGTFDAIFINAGVTHPRGEWLDRLAPGGRLLLPLTAPIPAMGPTLGKGLMILITRQDDEFTARQMSFVAIYSAVGLRDETLGAALGESMKKMPFPPLKRLRRDAHDQTDTCWLHAPGACFSI